MGLKNDIMGEMIKVKIELKENVDEMNFRGNFLEFCDQNIPSFMRPHILEFNYSKDDFKLKKMRK